VSHDEQLRRIRDRIGGRLGPPLAASRVEAFERELGVVLPEGFRRFVTEVGNGGAGPGYGWKAFDPDSSWFRLREWQGPFPGLAVNETADRDLPGTIELFDHGCGIFDFVVVHGPEAGNLWYSDDHCSVFPLPGPDFAFPRGEDWRRRLGDPRNTSRISFLDHFEAWLADHPGDR
jgi:hypothetical protein